MDNNDELIAGMNAEELRGYIEAQRIGEARLRAQLSEREAEVADGTKAVEFLQGCLDTQLAEVARRTAQLSEVTQQRDERDATLRSLVSAHEADKAAFEEAVTELLREARDERDAALSELAKLKAD